MSTLNWLVRTGILVVPPLQLEANELHCRRIFLSVDLCNWIDDHLFYEPPDWDKKIHPVEQVEDIFHRWVTGRPMAHGTQMKLLEPINNAVWEMKPTDVRIIGYFLEKATFIGVCGEMKGRLKRRRDYRPFISRVEVFRDALAVDDPKFMTETILAKLL